MERGEEEEMKVISASYGNDSVALIQWAHENGQKDLSVVFIDTGWAGNGWMERVDRLEGWVKTLGYQAVRLQPMKPFEELMVFKKGFPSQRYQWCSLWLKVMPFLKWLDEVDPDCMATILLGLRRAESQERSKTPEYIENSERHGGRDVWCPLFAHSDEERDALLARAGVEPLPHRSMECAPCINANRADLRSLQEEDIKKVESLEERVGKTMFRPARHNGAKGIREVIAWANASPGQYDPRQMSFGCEAGMCGS